MSIYKKIRKHTPELVALTTGKMPSFIYGKKYFSDIPVFCFHSAKYPGFENQLQFLKENKFRTLNADELSERIENKNYKNDGKDIVLTFDDGLASVWTVAFPLLQKFNYKIISFVLPGLTEDSEIVGKTILDTSKDSELFELANRDYTENPLCNWSEIEVMHASGHVDVQSHGMYHKLVSTSSKIIDFINPSFNKHNYGNIHIPAYKSPLSENSRNFVLGHPVYESRPRLAGVPRYFDDPGLRNACAQYVESNGKSEFFNHPGWKKVLNRFVDTYRKKNILDEDFESVKDQYNAMWYELKESKKIIEQRLKNKTVDHFCFPWFAASHKSAELAYDAGYKVMHLGATPGFKQMAGATYPHKVTRLQDEFLMHLPGKGNVSMIDIIKAKIKRKK